MEPSFIGDRLAQRHEPAVREPVPRRLRRIERPVGGPRQMPEQDRYWPADVQPAISAAVRQVALMIMAQRLAFSSRSNRGTCRRR